MVTLTVRDNANATVAGAAVTGTWSTGTSGGCTTAANGSCSFTTSMNKKTASATWSVSGITATGATYDAAANVLSSVTVSMP